MQTINSLLDQLESYIPQSDTVNKAISKANVAWHIEHSLLVLNSVTDFVASSDPSDYKWSFNFTRFFILTLKKIPRGKARAPKIVNPTEAITESSLKSHLSATRDKIKILSTLEKNNYLQHPYFGKIKLKQTINFLGIHTNHHVKIIEDIVK